VLDDGHAALGLLAGLLTSVLWTFTSIFFTAASRRLGSTVVNAARIVLAALLLALIYRFVTGDDRRWFPALEPRQLVLLALSGLIGLSLGDQALFTAFVDLGPRRATLIMTTAPIFAALLGLTVLGERLGLAACAGMAMTITGVAWVVLERAPGNRAEAAPAPHRARGVALAFVGAACQGGGLMLSKWGMGHGWLPEEHRLEPQAATFVRMSFAAIGMVPIVLAWRVRERRRAAAGIPKLARRVASGAAFTVLGALFGPVTGVWLSLVAADRVPVGVAQTLLSLTPIFILPYAALVEREHVSARAVVGAMVAVAGVAVLFLG
jgi:drug/metabolite transporter (DMT)-like permease